jgi:succinyl-diaminopimelate desuccinylase
MNTLDLSKKLISFRSVTNNRKICEQIVEFVIDYIQKNREKVYFRKFVYKNKHSVLFTTKDNLEIDFLMVGHLDVVSGKRSLFIPKENKGVLYGRGACDMKGTVSAMIHTYTNSNSKKNIGLYLSTDEEEGGEHGAKKLVGLKDFSCNTIFIPDSLPNWTLTIGQKGVDIIKISSKGKSCHSSEPWMGVNAVDNLIETYIELKMINGTKNMKKGTSISLNRIQGGNAMNVVPDEGEMILDVRHPTEPDRSKFSKTLDEVCNKNDVIWEVLVSGDCVEVDKESERTNKFLDIVVKRGIKYKVGSECGSSDARYFTKAKSCIMFMPVCGGAHEEKEWLDIKSLYIFEDMLREYVGLL